MAPAKSPPCAFEDKRWPHDETGGQCSRQRPFLDDGSQFGISRTQFRSMRKAEKRELMVQRFHQNFEDPAERTSYVTAEGGYRSSFTREAPVSMGGYSCLDAAHMRLKFSTMLSAVRSASAERVSVGLAVPTVGKVPLPTR